ncbi:MAG TPA: hypothetical protein VJW20_09465 [Candidatus Angelobacter sp.]|nr:hypothetical protein [Candidatus Angelobacter sp.]
MTKLQAFRFFQFPDAALGALEIEQFTVCTKSEQLSIKKRKQPASIFWLTADAVS